MSEQAVEVDRIPRHVRDLRPRISLEGERKLMEEKQGETEEWLIGLCNPAEPAQCGDDATEREMPRRSEREKRPVVEFAVNEIVFSM
ncbi:hypothetical protein Pmani_023458 [Petrolisthes manimaculis]|uniref:Uncharacterized protein n=1 Tax=Petrolisthes manimaculis TaxID=1843537 RepID=A0AAE1U3B4_9EUCA|nr:hypothetical protein Pmani_023458 [Petrolisthes manimaculis]